MNRFHRLYSGLAFAAATFLVFTQCDDSTGEIGSGIIPEQDIITAETNTYYAQSRTILANDSILANTSDVYLGKYTDAETGTVFCSSFVSQFGCTDDFEFPEEGVIGDSAKYTKVRLYFDEYYGDSLNAMKCEVYGLENTLIEGVPYYTNFSPEELYDSNKEPLATKVFNAVDYTLHDTILNGTYTKHIEIPLPNSIGNRFIEKFYETDGKKYFANSEIFINEVFKGIYVKCSHGDGTVFKIYRSRLDVGFDRYIKSSSGELDSVQSLSAPFYSGKEVLQANKFDNNDLKPLLDETGHTYIKSPAGLFTEVTLPVIDVIENSDTINSAKIEFTRYNEENNGSKAHNVILMLRKKDMYRFFLKNELANNNTSYLTSYSSSDNKYVFDNISNIFKTLYKEYVDGIESDSEWTTKNPDWDKVVLIPVQTTKDGNGNVVKIVHDLSISSMRLRGGDQYKIPIEVVTSKFMD